MFSEREQLIIRVIGRKKMTIADITNGVFKGKSKPLDAEISVGNSIRRIISKCKWNNLSWTFNKNRENKKLVIKRVKI